MLVHVVVGIRSLLVPVRPVAGGQLVKDEERDASGENEPGEKEPGEKEPGGEEIRSPLQASIRVILVVVVAVVLIGFIVALFLRPDEVVESAESVVPRQKVAMLRSVVSPHSVAPSRFVLLAGNAELLL